LWVLTKHGEVRPAKEVLLSTEFNPMPNWETFSQYVPGVVFLSPDYLPATVSDTELKSWCDFFKATRVKESPDNGVEDFAMKFIEHNLPSYCRQQLKVGCKGVTVVDARNFGYDLAVALDDGRNLCVEVKGLTNDRDIELTGNETTAADTYRDDYFLFIVSGIPERAVMHAVRNPAAIGRKDKLTIAVATWEQARWHWTDVRLCSGDGVTTESL
jgi:hypothetical protein